MKLTQVFLMLIVALSLVGQTINVVGSECVTEHPINPTLNQSANNHSTIDHSTMNHQAQLDIQSEKSMPCCDEMSDCAFECTVVTALLTPSMTLAQAEINTLLDPFITANSSRFPSSLFRPPIYHLS